MGKMQTTQRVPRNSVRLSQAAFETLRKIRDSIRPTSYERHFSRSIRNAVEHRDRVTAEKRRSLRLGMLTCAQLIGLREELGQKAFNRHMSAHVKRKLVEFDRIAPEILNRGRAFFRIAREVATIGPTISEFLSSEWFAEQMGKWERATTGHAKDIAWFLETELFDTLRSEQILDRIEGISETGSEREKQQVLKSFRKGYLGLKLGRPRKVELPAARSLMMSIQEIYNEIPMRLRRSYQNQAAWNLDAQELADRIAREFPPLSRTRVKTAVRDTLLEKLPSGKPKRRTRGFGAAVAARFYGVSVQHLRFLLRSV